MLLPTRAPAADVLAATAVPARGDAGWVAPQCAPSTVDTMLIERPGHRDTSADYPKDPRQKSIAGYGSQPYAFVMAAQAGSARAEGGPASPVEAAGHAASRLEDPFRPQGFGLPLVHVVRGIDPSG